MCAPLNNFNTISFSLSLPWLPPSPSLMLSFAFASVSVALALSVGP